MFRNLIFAFSLLSMTIIAWGSPKVPANIDHKSFNALLSKYVDEKGLVDYEAWHRSPDDLQILKDYLAQFDNQEAGEAVGDGKIASLINAYNAFTLSLILDQYPIESIRLIDDPFDGKRYRIGGELVSADDIEHEMLRPEIGWKVHSVVVCAARSCPPLLSAAYTPEAWEDQMKERYRTWLARPDLNRFIPGKGNRGKVELSRIFDWYEEDFTGFDSVRAILSRFGPPAYHDFLEKGEYSIDYMDYHWGLNAQSDMGKDYKQGILQSLF